MAGEIQANVETRSRFQRWVENFVGYSVKVAIRGDYPIQTALPVSHTVFEKAASSFNSLPFVSRPLQVVIHCPFIAFHLASSFSLPQPLLNTIRLEYYFVHMQLSHIPLPSFTLVLTSGRSLYGEPILTIPDHSMKTIDLRYVPNDNSALLEDRGSSADSVCESVDTWSIFELERPTTSNGGAKRNGNVSIKNLALLVFLAFKRRLTRY